MAKDLADILTLIDSNMTARGVVIYQIWGGQILHNGGEKIWV